MCRENLIKGCEREREVDEEYLQISRRSYDLKGQKASTDYFAFDETLSPRRCRRPISLRTSPHRNNFYESLFVSWTWLTTESFVPGKPTNCHYYCRKQLTWTTHSWINLWISFSRFVSPWWDLTLILRAFFMVTMQRIYRIMRRGNFGKSQFVCILRN